MAQIVEVSLPESWPKHAKTAILYTVSLASSVFKSMCG